MQRSIVVATALIKIDQWSGVPDGTKVGGRQFNIGTHVVDNNTAEWMLAQNGVGGASVTEPSPPPIERIVGEGYRFKP